MSDGELVVERHDHVLLLRLNRPEVRNALNPSLIRAFGAAVAEAESDPGVRALVLTGTGDRAFSSGMDLRSFAETGDMAMDSPEMETFLRFMDGGFPLPVVGAAQAAAVAGGLELLLGCDVVVAARGARFGLPEVQRGLIPGGGGTLLATRIPLAAAMELVLTGDPVDADRARQIGLVNVVVAPDEVLATALAMAARIAGNGPLAVRAAKELTRLGASSPSEFAARREHWRRAVFASEDAREGAAAFVEKRAARWQGR